MIALLTANGGMKAIELAQRVYGPNPDNKAQSRIRSVLWALNKRGRIKSLGKGRWGIKDK